MNELHKNTEVKDGPKLACPAQQDIKPKSSIPLSEAIKFFQSKFENMGWGGHYAPERRIPSKERVDWSSTPGDSFATPKEDYVSKNEGISGKEVKEILSQYGISGITYRNKEPDFSPCSESTVKISDMSGKCTENAAKADAKAAEQWNKERRDNRSDWKASDVRKYRDAHNLTWHERCDMKTMDLVPTAVNHYFSHTGGCAECKAKANLENNRNHKHKGGNQFDAQ